MQAQGQDWREKAEGLGDTLCCLWRLPEARGQRAVLPQSFWGLSMWAVGVQLPS